MLRKFTLIELIVVISILGILLSILLPSLVNSRERARLLVCTSNLKQISVLKTIYGQSNNGYLPIYRTGIRSHHNIWGKDKIGLERSLAPYMNVDVSSNYLKATGSDIFMCPSAPVKFIQSTFKYEWFEDSNIGSYMNTYEGLYYHYAASTANTALANPSKKILQTTSYANPEQHPFQWCSRRQAPVWKELSSTQGNNLLAAASWHSRNDFAPRPTVFLDNHVRILKSPTYTKHGRQEIMHSGSGYYLRLLEHEVDEF
ncbi:MAG: prepilin-type N-terminal cleavage/methylation domain-containing protein [Lentisphaeraceae bacterium]|nr:prepilin-type N-terminal cleavage/methylation domain-containing protein [Lentisphaeraceae bacterium]